MNLRNPFVIVTIPLAFAFGLIWFRRKKIHRDTGEKNRKEEELVKKQTTDNTPLKTTPSTSEQTKRPHFEHSCSLPIEKTPTKNNIQSPINNNDSFDFKFGKSAPIDITPHKTSPSRIKDGASKHHSESQKDKSLKLIEENSFDSIDLPGSVDRRFSGTNIVRSSEPIVVVKASNMVKNSSPQSSFEVASQTPTPKQSKDNTPTDKNNLSDAKKALQVSTGSESQQHSMPVSSPPLSLCSNKSSQSHESADSGKGSSPPNSEGGQTNASTTVVCDYEIGQQFVGFIVGKKGVTIRDIQLKSGARIDLRRHPLKSKKLKWVSIKGTEKQVDAALAMVKAKLPPRTDLVRIDFDLDSAETLARNGAVNIDLLQLQLIDGINNDVVVSTIVDAGSLFVQQPLHPTYPSLNRLQNVMSQSYSTHEAPALPNYNVDTICVGCIENHWYRLQIIDDQSDENVCVAKYLDFGGYCSVQRTDLKQIRADFMTTPFQAIETRLADIKPKGK